MRQTELSISPELLRRAMRSLGDLAEETAIFIARPGQPHPMHVVYGGADRFRHDTARKLGELGLRALKEHAPHYISLAKILNLPGHEKLPLQAAGIAEALAEADAGAVREEHRLLYEIYQRVVRRLQDCPVEKFTIDFEDGLGPRSDEEEDRLALEAAEQVSIGMRNGTLPPFMGIRVRAINVESGARAMRTLDLFLTRLVALAGALPDNFTVTVPKVIHPEQVRWFRQLLDDLESNLQLERGAVGIELMVETAASLFDDKGRVALPALAEAAGRRLRGFSFGTYDFTAELGVSARFQQMNHPVCDLARGCMLATVGQRGLWLSDGATNEMPIGPYRGDKLHDAQKRENHRVVCRAWRTHFANVSRSLQLGMRMGWDLHAAQLPIRFAAHYSFVLAGLEAECKRLRSFVDVAAKATLTGAVMDDAATGQGLINSVVAAVDCGAIDRAEVVRMTGLTEPELRSRSFSAIIRARSGLGRL